MCTEVVAVPKEAVPTHLLVQISSIGPVAVPKEAVPTNLLAQISVGPVPVPKVATDLLVQSSSIGPVPPAVAAAAEPTAPEYPADGLATIFLCPSGPNNLQFSSTSQLMDVTDAKPLELITLEPHGPPTFVTYKADFERFAKYSKCSALQGAPSSMAVITNDAALAFAVKAGCIRAIPFFSSWSRRGIPPDRSRSEEWRLTRTSIPARLAVRRGDRATA